MLTNTLSIKINKTQNSKISKVDFSNLAFGKDFTDHMLVMDYENGAWQQPQIIPYQDFTLSPATSVLHYGQAIFEGMKAARDVNGNINLFRPLENGLRLKYSAERICMPVIDPEYFVQLLSEFVRVEEAWVPKELGHSLYLRPTMIAMDGFLGLKPSQTYRFFIIASPVASYYAAPVNVKIEEEYSRAAPGGVGAAKTAGNYAASLYPAKKGQDAGYDQLIWTNAIDHSTIEESGSMNVCFVLDGKLVTPKSSETILSGITRKSVTELVKHWGLPVEERVVTVAEIIDGLKTGKVTEAFGAGTAAAISHIASITYRGEKFDLPSVENRPLSNKVGEYLANLRAGKQNDELNWIVKL